MNSLQPDYKYRRQRLRNIVQRGVVVLFKGSEHFNENLFYLTGLETFYTFAVISLESSFECVLTNPIESPHIGNTPQLSDIRPISPDSLLSELLSLLHALKPSEIYCETDLHSKTPLPSSIYAALSSSFDDVPISNIPSALTRMRLTKDTYEIAVMRRGIEIVSNVFASLEEIIAPGISEMELSAEIHRQLVRGGFNKFYDICVASGPRSAIPYYRANNNLLPDSGVVMIDIAAAVDNYVCDMTRTFPITGIFNEREQALHNLVVDVQETVIVDALPGTTLNVLNKRAFTIFSNHNLERYYYNKIGHFLGLGVDDQGENDVVLEKGMVVTIEPGLYLNHEGLGIRKEDMIFL